MRFTQALIVTAVMAAVSYAQPSKYDSKCFHCINEGYAFCSADGKTGKCIDVSCTEADVQGQERRDNRAKGVCSLEYTGCDTSQTTAPFTKAMTYFSQCDYPEHQAPVAGCPSEVIITKAQIESGGIEKLNHADELEYFPYQQKYTLPANSVCKTQFRLKTSDFTGTTQKGGFSPTEWQEVDIMLTSLKDGATWGPDMLTSTTQEDVIRTVPTSTKAVLANKNSALYSAETFYYNPEAKDGDLAGRVMIDTNETWQVLMLNYEDKEQSVIFEYGAAVKTMLTYVGLTASALTLAYSF